jgi:hypothetical protein
MIYDMVVLPGAKRVKPAAVLKDLEGVGIQLSWLHYLHLLEASEMPVRATDLPEFSELLYSSICVFIWGGLPVLIIFFKEFNSLCCAYNHYSYSYDFYTGDFQTRWALLHSRHHGRRVDRRQVEKSQGAEWLRNLRIAHLDWIMNNSGNGGHSRVRWRPVRRRLYWLDEVKYILKRCGILELFCSSLPDIESQGTS